MKQLISDHCINCPYRDDCTTPCKEVEEDLKHYYAPAREIAWSELTDIPIEQSNIKSPWSEGSVLTNSNWIALIRKLKSARIKLTTRQKTYTYLYYIAGLHQSEIADMYKVSQQVVSKVIAAARIKLIKLL